MDNLLPVLNYLWSMWLFIINHYYPYHIVVLLLLTSIDMDLITYYYILYYQITINYYILLLHFIYSHSLPLLTIVLHLLCHLEGPNPTSPGPRVPCDSQAAPLNHSAGMQSLSRSWPQSTLGRSLATHADKFHPKASVWTGNGIILGQVNYGHIRKFVHM